MGKSHQTATSVFGLDFGEGVPNLTGVLDPELSSFFELRDPFKHGPGVKKDTAIPRRAVLSKCSRSDTGAHSRTRMELSVPLRLLSRRQSRGSAPPGEERRGAAATTGPSVAALPELCINHQWSINKGRTAGKRLHFCACCRFPRVFLECAACLSLLCETLGDSMHWSSFWDYSQPSQPLLLLITALSRHHKCANWCEPSLSPSSKELDADGT